MSAPLTHYHSASRGPVEIASMNPAHLANARDKLAREEPHRRAEIAAMSAHLDVLNAEEKANANG